MLNLDTHIVLHALADQLTPDERQVLSGDQWSVSPIVFWEIAKLAQLGRIKEDLDDPDLLRLFSSIHVWPLSLDICRAARTLDFVSDPADELIAATSVFHRIPLLTRDRKIRRSRIVPLVALK